MPEPDDEDPPLREPEQLEVTCPNCHRVVANRPAVRSGTGEIHGIRVGIVDVGYHCSACGHEWGFAKL